MKAWLKAFDLLKAGKDNNLLQEKVTPETVYFLKSSIKR